MKHRKLRIAWSVAWGALLCVCGCDGHVHAFKPLPAPGETAAETTAYKQKLVDAVTAVAVQREYTRWSPPPDSGTLLHFSKELGRGRVGIQLFADKNSGGEYQVSLLDWPSTARSAESIAVEAAIRQKLGVRDDERPEHGLLIEVLIATALISIVLGLVVWATRYFRCSLRNKGASREIETV